MRLLLQTVLLLYTLTCSAVDAEVEGSVRLRGGRVPLGGRVEVLYGGEWGTVRDGRWGVEDASVVCRQLGFTHAQVTPRGIYFEPAPLSTPVHFNRVGCHGNESSLLECEANIVRERNRSNHAWDAGVVCAADYSPRLVPVNVSSPDGAGRLELFLEGEWRAVCAGGWEREEATVTCRQLGYEQLVQFSSESYSSSDPPVVTVETNCSGDEFHLLSCNPSTPPNLCITGMAVSLHCRGSPVPPGRPRLEQATCSSLQITWNIPSNRGSNITSYTLRYKTHASSPLLWEYVHISRLDPTWEHIGTTLAGLAPAAQYEVQVRAENGVGNSSYSASLVVTTLPADVLPPEQLRRDSVGSDSATLSWTAVPPCGTSVAGYELVYSTLGSPNTSQQYSFIPQTVPLDSPTNMTFVLNNLRPFSRYEIRMRTVGNSGRGDNATLLVSNFTEPVDIRTLEAVPSGAPKTLSVFLSHLHASAEFQWDPIPQEEENGLITDYFFSCQYTINRHLQTIRKNFNSSVFHYELRNLEPGTDYECHVSAGTAVGQGPESACVEFATPTDLNIRPNPPANVAFEVRGQSDSGSPLISARWDVVKCGNNFSCSQALGYVATCQEELTRYELRKTVWQSEVQDVAVAMTTMVAAPYTRYSCKVASLNSYGIGFAGSIFTVETPESAPSRAPTLLYASNPQPTSMHLHWSYSELPPTGRLLGFKIKLYHQDPRYPERNTVLVLEEMHDLMPFSTTVTDFSYDLMYLSPGVGYNVYVSAHTIAGEGPQARIAVSTLRTAPVYVPTNLQVEVISYQEPFRYSFTWQLPASATPSFIHTGFMLHCYPNTTANGAQNLNTSHAVFANSIQSEYSATLSPPGSCALEIDTFLCSVSAFNERGESPQSGEVEMQLPCIIDSSAGDVFAGTFLSQPYYSLAFLSALVLLIILVLIAIVTLCICNRCIGDLRERRKKHLNPYSSADTYDESYISMAPSSATRVKSYWTDRSMSCTTGTTGVATSIIRNSTETYNPYDEIPGDRLENLYDEIHPMTRVISTITDENLQDSADSRKPTSSGVLKSTVDESGVEFLQQSNINDPNGPTPFTSPRTSSYVPDIEFKTTPIDGIQIPTQIPLQADYVEILSGSMSRAVVQSGREDPSIACPSVADLSQEQNNLQFGPRILPHYNSQETDSTNQGNNAVGNAGNIPTGTPISSSALEVTNPDPFESSYDHLAAPHEDSEQFSNVTSTDLSVNAGSSSTE